MKIWRYDLKPLAVTELLLSDKDVAVSAVGRGTIMSLYVECHDGKTTRRRFALFPTGTGTEHGAPDLDVLTPVGFIGTVEWITPQQRFVFHVYEVE